MVILRADALEDHSGDDQPLRKLRLKLAFARCSDTDRSIHRLNDGGDRQEETSRVLSR